MHQGDLYWLQVEASDIPHPYVVIQDDALNDSPIETVVVCALTSNLKRVSLPGNVLLEAGEGNLPRQSVIEVSKVETVAKTQLGDYIGSLDERRIQQIFAGIRFLERTYFTHK